MAIPWLRILDAVLGVTDLVVLRKATTRQQDTTAGQTSALDQTGRFGAGSLEARLGGVMVAALKEAFDRDNRRLDLERERAEAERLQAERALRLEMRRQATDREIGRLRLIGGAAVITWLGSLLLWRSMSTNAGSATRVVLGLGWALLLAALATALTRSDAANRAAIDDLNRESPPPGGAGVLAGWFLVLGLALIGLAALLA
jgi:hypothetical protein